MHDEPRRTFAGVGPRGYARPDARILDDVCEALMRRIDLDARLIRVRVEQGIVFLEGRVASRDDRRLAEELAASVRGVRDVEVRLRVRRPDEDGLDDEVRRGLFGRIVEDHRILTTLLEIARRTPASEPHERRAAFAAAYRELLAHTAAEEEVLYPVLAGPAGLHDEVEGARHDHARVEGIARELETTSPTAADWTARLRELVDHLIHHVRTEEGQLLRVAQRALDYTRQEALATEFLRAKARHLAAGPGVAARAVEATTASTLGAEPARPPTLSDAARARR